MSQHDLAKIVGKNIAEQRRTIGMSQKDLLALRQTAKWCI